MKMPWGKFKGKDIHDLPSSYLLWIAENVNEDSDFNKKIVKEVDQEYSHREKYNTHSHFEE